MIADIASRREELRELCRRFHVGRLDLFGSAAGDDFDAERSDLDFLVEFQPVPPGADADAIFGLKESLEQLFGRPLDLVAAGPPTIPISAKAWRAAGSCYMPHEAMRRLYDFTQGAWSVR